MQNQFIAQQFNNLSQKIVEGPSQHSMLNDAIKHLPFQFPQPLPILEQGLNNIPPYKRSPNLYKQIHSYNKKLIYSQFQLLCQKVTRTYSQSKGVNNSINFSHFQSRLYTIINNQFPNGGYLTSELSKNINQLKGNQNQLEFVKNILFILGFSHASFYNLSIRQSQGNIGNEGFYMTNSNPFQSQVPDKYKRIIEGELSSLAKPVSANFFQNLVMNTLQGQNQQQSSQNLKTQAQIQAQKAADALKKLFTSKYIEQNQTKDGQNKQNTKVPTCSIIQKMIHNEVQQNRGSYCFSPNINNNNQQQQNILLTLAQSIQNQQFNNRRQGQQYKKNDKQLEFDQWFNDNYVKMSYYQSYMMAHMANLIFLTPQKFDITLINYHPYIFQLNQQIRQELASLKSELIGYRMIFESNLKIQNQKPFYNPYNNNIPYQNSYGNQTYQQNQFPIGNSFRNQSFDQTKSYDSKSNKGKKQSSLLDKAAGFFKNICVSSKQQGSFSKKKSEKERTKQHKLSQGYNQIKQTQNQLISENFPAIQSYYYHMIQILQQANNYFVRFEKEVPHLIGQSFNEKKQDGVLKKLFHKVQSKKQQLTGQNLKYYHEVQSWMSIVMLLYRQIGFNKIDGYNYSCLKRRTIIKICKRIFIQQRKKDKKKNLLNKSTINHSFRNWPLVLKFLQNSRPQIMSDPLSGANQKQVDRILQDFYSVMRQKRMVGSSFGNLFDGLPPLKQTLPQIKLVCLSSGTNPTQNLNKSKLTSQCKVVHILISGFLSQDTDKLQQWSDMVDLMPDSEVYALVWQSTTIKGLVKFFFKSAVDIVGAMKMMDEIRRKYVDNPFNPAFQVAQITGRILAELVVRLFPNRFVNVCGYSLGSEVIKQFLQGIINRKKTQILNNIYLMGGVSDAKGFGDLVSKSQTPLSLYNCYTMNDSVLKNLLSLCKPDIKAVGLNQIRKIGGHSVINVDCTKIISGHLAFRSNLSLMGQLLEISTG